MDAFVKIHRQKKVQNDTLHHKEIDRLKQLISRGKNVMLCGAHGFGKTFILNEVLDELNSIEMPYNYKASDELKGSNMCIFYLTKCAACAILSYTISNYALTAIRGQSTCKQLKTLLH